MLDRAGIKRHFFPSFIDNFTKNVFNLNLRPLNLIPNKESNKRKITREKRQ